MASKTLTLFLGGKERTLCFGKFGFTENIADITGADPFEFLTKERKLPKEQFEFVETIVYAGLLSQSDFDGSKVDFKKEDVHQWVKGLEFSEAAIVINDCTSALLSLFDKDKPGEPVAQTNHKEEIPITS